MIAHRYAELSQVRMHYHEAGNGNDVVLLLHGWPHTSHAWRHVIPNLVGRDVGDRTDLMKEAFVDSGALEVHSRNVHVRSSTSCCRGLNRSNRRQHPSET